jgi:cytochrome c553
MPVFDRACNAADDSVKENASLCTPCHGETGVTQIENTPSLAGQPDLFLQWQLIFFRSGSRKNEVMQPIAEQLSNEGIRNLGAYFASLPPATTTKPEESSQTEAGAKIVAGRSCASCHTDAFAGTKGTARIAGQGEDYLVKALHDYKSGARSGSGVTAMASSAPLARGVATHSQNLRLWHLVLSLNHARLKAKCKSAIGGHCCANDPDLPLPEFTAAIDDKRYLFSVFHRLRDDPFGG